MAPPAREFFSSEMKHDKNEKNMKKTTRPTVPFKTKVLKPTLMEKN